MRDVLLEQQGILLSGICSCFLQQMVWLVESK